MDPVPVAFVVDGVRTTPRVLAHAWTPDGTTTTYGLTDGLRVTERKGIRGDVLCADWRFDGAGRVEVAAHVPPLLRARCGELTAEIPLHATQDAERLRVGLGCAPEGSLDHAPFTAWLARHAPRLECDSPELAHTYAYRWFGVYRSLRRPARWFGGHPMPGELLFAGPAPDARALPHQIREARWMRAPRGVQDTLDAWSRGALGFPDADPYTAAIEFAEHHPLRLYAARNAALELVLAGRVPAMRHALGLVDEPPPEPERPWLDRFFRDPPAGVRLEGVPFKDGEISVERSPRAAGPPASGSRRSSPRR